MRRIVLNNTALAVVAMFVTFVPAVVIGEFTQGSRFGKSDWSDPLNLGAVNSSFSDQNPFLSKDELSLYFTSNRPGGLGGLDIYVSHRASVDSPWQVPANLGPPINTESTEVAPNLSVDGHLLFFTSGRPGGQGDIDIYV